jgi:DNA-binding transcriptional regulator YiaG
MDSGYGNNRANAYMLQRQLTAVDKHYRKTYGEYPRTGEKIHNPINKPKNNWLQQRSRSYQEQKHSTAKAILNTFKRHTEWHQKDIATFLGVNQSAISTWNTGKAKMPEKHEKKLIEILRSKVPEFKERYDQYQEGYMKRASNF